MASFTDIIPQFKEYVPQLPVEAMVQVGIQKQKMYEENVQKIQNQIDNIAGLSIMHPDDKNYLQSKLNELGNNLKIFAAGDFSNFQLANSISGMTGQIIKDKNVQNAVSSTEFIKRQQAQMDEDRKKGTLHANNESYFNEQVSDYLSKRGVGQVFNSPYLPYTDYQKKWREIQKDLGVKEIQTDLPFLMDKAGNYVDAKGNILPPGAKPIPNDYMVREKFKGIDAQRLKEAIMVSMDDNDYRQMGIDAHVKYRGYSTQNMYDIAKEEFDKNEAATLKTIENLTLLKNQNVGNQANLDQINDQLEKYTKKLNDDKAEFEETVADLQANPEGFKRKMFMMNSINNFSTAFSNMSHIQEIVDSPIRKQMNEDRNYNFRVTEFQTKNAQWQQEFRLSLRRQDFAESKEAWDRSVKQYELGFGPSPFGGGKYVGAITTDPDLQKGLMESFKLGADLTQLDNDKNLLMVQWAKNQPSKAQYEKQLKRTLTDAEYKDVLKKQFYSDLASYTSNKGSVDPISATVFENYTRLDNIYKLKANVVSDIKTQVDNEFRETEEKFKKSGMSGYLATQFTKELQKKKDERFNQLLGEKINLLAPVTQNLSKDAPTRLLPVIEEKLAREQKGETEQVTGFVSGKDFNIDATRYLAASPDTKVTYTSWGDDVFITLTGKYDKKPVTQKFKLSRGEFNNLFPAFAENTDTDMLQSSSANGSTNYKYHVYKSAADDPKDAFSSAMFDIPSKKYIVKADVFFDQNNKNATIPVIYVKSKKTGNVIPIIPGTSLTYNGSQGLINQINDLFIDNQFKNKSLDANF